MKDNIAANFPETIAKYFALALDSIQQKMLMQGRISGSRYRHADEGI